MGSFLSGLRSLFEEHYVNVPDEKYDLINSMAEKIDEMEEKLNEQIEKNVALNRRLAESKSDGIFAEISEGLPLIQKEKLASLAENLEFDSEEGYREKLVTLKESYFSSNGDSRETISENLTESADVIEMPGRDVTPTMERYLQTLSRVSKK
jgi:predicted nuclease with TOPRIM domain